MIKRFIALILTITLCLSSLVGCTTSDTGAGISDTTAAYEQISTEEAKSIMDSEEDYIILDVRTQEEYDSGHIAGAILIPDTEIGSMAEATLTDKDALILVYCRSGRRSKNAASELATLGYTNVKEFGGINSWTYGTVSE